MAKKNCLRVSVGDMGENTGDRGDRGENGVRRGNKMSLLIFTHARVISTDLGLDSGLS
jgi:hypothetical protein